MQWFLREFGYGHLADRISELLISHQVDSPCRVGILFGITPTWRIALRFWKNILAIGTGI
jgi:hypothetical protein